jgi:hypothetical protein
LRVSGSNTHLPEVSRLLPNLAIPPLRGLTLIPTDLWWLISIDTNLDLDSGLRNEDLPVILMPLMMVKRFKSQ